MRTCAQASQSLNQTVTAERAVLRRRLSRSPTCSHGELIGPTHNPQLPVMVLQFWPHEPWAHVGRRPHQKPSTCMKPSCVHVWSITCMSWGRAGHPHTRLKGMKFRPRKPFTQKGTTMQVRRAAPRTKQPLARPAATPSCAPFGWRDPRTSRGAPTPSWHTMLCLLLCHILIISRPCTLQF